MTASLSSINHEGVAACVAEDIGSPNHIILSVFTVNEFDATSSNTIWLHKRDIVRLYPDYRKTEEIPRYARIANVIYEISLQKGDFSGWMGMNLLQWQNVHDASFAANLNASLVLSSCDPALLDVPEMTQMTFNLNLHQGDHVVSECPLVFELTKLEHLVRKNLSRNIVTAGQSFMIETEKGVVELRLKNQRSSSLMESQRVRFGKITDSTLIDFDIEGDSIVVVDRVFNQELKKCTFSVELVKRTESATDVLPIVLSSEELSSPLFEAIEGKVITLDQKIVIPHHSGWDIYLHLANVGYSIPDDFELRNEKYPVGFEIESEKLIHFDLKTENALLIQGNAVPTREIRFTITDISEDQLDCPIDLSRERWVSRDEFTKEIQALTRKFAKGENFEIDLSSGRFWVHVLSAVPAIESDHNLEYDRLFSVDSASNIKIQAEYSVDVEVVRDADPKDLILLKLLFIEARDSESADARKLVERHLKRNPPKSLVRNQLVKVDVNEALSYEVKIVEMEKEDDESDENRFLGRITGSTQLVFEGEEDKSEEVILVPDIKDPVGKLEELGMGGLKDQVQQIIRTIFLSRGKMRKEFLRRKMKPVRGLLLYGPPGTGKTTLARHLADLLGCSGERLNMIAGTEVFNMWAGESEKNVRELFEPARKAAAEQGDDSPLYVVVIDEIDSVLPVRQSGSNEWRTSVVDQFLAEMDGLHQIHNILVIGMTNRLDHMDPAALRTGRFSEQIEMEIPDEDGRMEIYRIHTRVLREENLLHEDVDLKELVKRSPGYSGADIEGLVQKASTFSLERLSLLDVSEGVLESEDEGKVTMEDFDRAFTEIKRESDDMDENVRRSMYT